MFASLCTFDLLTLWYIIRRYRRRAAGLETVKATERAMSENKKKKKMIARPRADWVAVAAARPRVEEDVAAIARARATTAALLRD